MSPRRVSRHGTNGKPSGAPEDSAGAFAFVWGALVSVVLPLSGIAYFVAFKLQEYADDVSGAAAATLEVTAATASEVAAAVGPEVAAAVSSTAEL